MIARELKISARAAQDMAPMLGLRELTGRDGFGRGACSAARGNFAAEPI